MHDGYLFTLGVCGSADEGDPAPDLLSALLGAIPPVKRAAFLGPPPAGDDELIAAALADVADAELLVIVAPAHPAGLPPRLAALLAAVGPDLRGRHALLVAYDEAGRAALRAWAAQSGRVATALIAAQATPAAARAAYAAARAAHAPGALP